MSTRRRIIIACLDTSAGSTANVCLWSDHFDIAEFDQTASVASRMASA